MLLSNLPAPSSPLDPSAFAQLEEEYEKRSKRKKSDEEDEEEQGRTMKYQIHERELGNQNDRDTTMGSINNI